MAKDYSVQGTTKLQREKYAVEALGLSTLDAPPPSEDTMKLVQNYIDGKCEISEVLNITIQRYSMEAANA